MFFISYIEFSRVQQEFARGLSQFRFQTIGTEKTEDEVLIGILTIVSITQICTRLNIESWVCSCS